MANFAFEGVDDLIHQLESLGSDIDDVAYEMIDEAAEIMDNELREAIKNNTKEYGTGELADSIHHNKPKKNAWGYFAVSTARGKDTKKGRYKKKSHAAYSKNEKKYVGHREEYGGGAVRNQDKLFWKEYGNSRQDAKPFMQKCVNTAEPKVLKKMQEVFDREVDKR